MQKHMREITQDDIDNYPDLTESGYGVGDQVEFDGLGLDGEGRPFPPSTPIKPKP